MSRTHQDWPTLKHPDGELLEAIHQLDRGQILRALDKGAAINCRVQGLWGEMMTPLSETLSCMPYSEARYGKGAVASGILAGYITRDLYQREQTTQVALLAEHGADFLDRNALLMLPVDAALRYTADCDNAPALAQAVLHTEMALQINTQTYRPDLTSIFMQTGTWRFNERSQQQRTQCMTGISDVARLVTQRLAAPDDLVSERVSSKILPATRRYWQELADAPPNPNILPHPSVAFIAMTEQADTCGQNMIALHINAATPERAAANFSTHSAVVKSLQTQHRRDWLSHQYKMELG